MLGGGSRGSGCLPPSSSSDLKASYLPHPYAQGTVPEAGPPPLGSTWGVCRQKI